tara:strand:+ start:324 stop:533 length:210 start_codon:yes stop_codon:yes gene_type:complete
MLFDFFETFDFSSICWQSLQKNPKFQLFEKNVEILDHLEDLQVISATLILKFFTKSQNLKISDLTKSTK